ncbi:unnamed protein product [Phytophthora fragariaefolia]|uniref:Unnamed protein product n=1 Tax=Phytophthora fragariaefolia TaxID=1490495 RepID=A0A9W6XD85_9STRA|nr:unnamed protein product [Phytophthora fragariaefolia]
MAKESSSLSRGSPVTAGGSPAERSNSASQLAADTTVDVARSVQFEDDDARGQGYDEEDEDDEEKEEVDVEYVKSTAELLGEVEELSLQVSRMGNPRPVERNLVAELDASADGDGDEDDQGVVEGERPSIIPKATWNADTPSANKVLARLGEEMRTRSAWMMMFAPVATAQANRSNSLIQSGWSLARASAELTQWKRRLRAEIGLEKASGARQTIMDRVAEFTQLGADPCRVPLPKTPETKRPAKGERFRPTVGTPYFEDSHMFDSEEGQARGGRYDHLYDASDEAELADSRDDSADLRGDRDETVKDQTRRLSYDEAERDSSQYLELPDLRFLDPAEWVCSHRQYPGGADAAGYVEQFLLNCGNDGIMDLLYPLQLADIQRLEQIINKKILGEKRNKQWDRLVASRVGEARHNDGPQRRDVSRRGDIHRDHPDGRRGETHESHRDDRRSRRDDNRERRVTVAHATVDDLYRGGEPLARFVQHR